MLAESPNFVYDSAPMNTPTLPDMIGRTAERDGLLRALRHPESQFVAVYGRRRVGKTYLVRKTFGNAFAFYHTGVFDGPFREQLLEFRDSLRECGLSDCPDLKDWRGAFAQLRRLLESKPDGKKIVFLDELPWMETRNSRFVAQLDKFWNKWASARDDVVLVVCGSAASWMIRNVIDGYGGLHDRITDRIAVKPFDLAECEAYADRRGLGMSRTEVAETYMVFGGVPYYWGFLRKGAGLAQNLDELLFAEDGKLRGEFGRLFRSLFKDSRMHVETLESLARRKAGKTRSEILEDVPFSDGGKFSECLEALEACGFVRSFDALGKAKKDKLYQLIDNFTLFHMKFLAAGSGTGPDFWTSTVESPLQSTWKGLAFERLCLQHVRQIKAALGIAGVRTNVCSWVRAPDGNGNGGAQVDLVIDRADGVTNLCEIKYCHGPYVLSKEECAKLLKRRDVFKAATRTRKSVHLTMITPEGVAETPERHFLQSELTLDDLFRP